MSLEMRTSQFLNYALIIFCAFGLPFVFKLSVYCQSSESEKPKIKDFGKSLRKNNTDDKSKKGEVEKDGKEENDVIKIETNLVISDFLVLDTKGNPVLGLNAKDFLITENNILQEITTFSLGDSAEIPRSIVLLIDTSGSQKPFIETSVEAAKILIDKLNPQDRVAIVTDDVAIWTQFTKDKSKIKSRLTTLLTKYTTVINTDRIPFEIDEPFPNRKPQSMPTTQTQQFQGRSKQYSALMATLNELFDKEDIRPIVIFQTDGDQYFCLKPIFEQCLNPKLNGEPAFSFDELYNKVEKSRATIFSIVSGHSIFDLSPEERLKKVKQLKIQRWHKSNGQLWELPEMAEMMFAQQDSMAKIAKISGGFTQELEKPEQADEIYSRILSSITKRYLVGYYPKNEERDGKRREVKVEVRGHPEYIIWGRKYYFAPSPR